jgi:hypothetical protein
VWAAGVLMRREFRCKAAALAVEGILVFFHQHSKVLFPLLHGCTVQLDMPLNPSRVKH